jgi:hypothetical protein
MSLRVAGFHTLALSQSQDSTKQKDTNSTSTMHQKAVDANQRGQATVAAGQNRRTEQKVEASCFSVLDSIGEFFSGLGKAISDLFNAIFGGSGSSSSTTMNIGSERFTLMHTHRGRH